MATMAATPYDITASFFFFDDFRDFEEKASEHKNEHGDHVEEYEIQLVDGDSDELQFAKIYEPDQANLEDWFDHLHDYELLDDHQKLAIDYLVDDRSMSFIDVWEQFPDVQIIEGTPEDYANELLEEGAFGELSEIAWRYFDTEALGRDLDLNGDIDTYEKDGRHYVVTNACEF